MIVTVVGSGDAFGSGGRFQTCFALGPSSGPPHTLIDCGATSLVALRQQGHDPHAITTVILSHLHGDHFGGLPFLILDGQFRRRSQNLTVTGPPGTRQRLTEAMEALFPGSSTVTRRFEIVVHEYQADQPLRVDGHEITPVEVRHNAGAPAYAVRVVHNDTTIAYSGDTEWTETLIHIAHAADLFLVEGYAPEPIRGHLDLASLAANRHRFTARRLLLTHLSPSALDHIDSLTEEVAYDGMTIALR